MKFQHTAARRRLKIKTLRHLYATVSTHSRPKAADSALQTPGNGEKFQHTAARRRLVFPAARCSRWRSFNTQPPEGGWAIRPIISKPCASFNTQPPEGGCKICGELDSVWLVSTHSRPKAAVIFPSLLFIFRTVSTHSRPKAAASY